MEAESRRELDREARTMRAAQVAHTTDELNDPTTERGRGDGLRCADCGERGERTGHMTCQYPQDHA